MNIKEQIRFIVKTIYEDELTDYDGEEEILDLLKEAFFMGWEQSGEGCNAEYFHGNEREFLERRFKEFCNNN